MSAAGRGAGSAAKECRCACGNLLARAVAGGIELKCRRCKRCVTIAWAALGRERAGPWARESLSFAEQPAQEKTA